LRLCWETSRGLFSVLVASALAASLFPAALAGLAGYAVTQVEASLKGQQDGLIVLMPALGLIAGIIVLVGVLQAIRF
jgi:hypothetical protein